MCWYTDSIDNDFIADYVPGYDDTLFVSSPDEGRENVDEHRYQVASGGSGHGFKFLPVLGHVSGPDHRSNRSQLRTLTILSPDSIS